MIRIGDPRGFGLLLLWAVFFVVLLRRLRRKRAALSTFFLIRPLVNRLTVLGRRFRFLRRLAFVLFLLAAGWCALAGLRLSWEGGRPPLRELVLVDLSPSLGAREGGIPRRDLLRGRLAEYLGRLRSEDRVTVVTAGPRAEVREPLSPRGELATLAAALDWADAPADIDGALALALADGPLDPSHVLLFSDRPERWRSSPRWKELEPRVPRFITFGSPGGNSGITAFDIRGDLWRPGFHDLFVRVRCGRVTGGPSPGEVTVRVMSNGTLRRTVTRTCRPGDSLTLLLPGIELEPGRVEVALEPGGIYAGDDRVVAGVGGEEHPVVYAVTPGNRFLEQALAAWPGGEARVLAPGDRLPEDPRAIFVFDGTAPDGPPPRRALFIQPTVPPTGLIQRGVRPGGGAVEWDHAAAILRGVDFADFSPKGYLEYEANAEWRTPVTVDGRPLILLGGESGRRWAVLAFDPSQTAFVYTSSYPVLLANLLRWEAAAAEPEHSWMPAGREVALPGAAGGGRVEEPGGARLPLAVGADGDVRFDARHPGRYEVFARGGESLGVFYLNLLDEGITAELDREDYGSDGSSLPAALPRLPSVLPLAPAAALLALLLLAAEALIARRQTGGVEEP